MRCRNLYKSVLLLAQLHIVLSRGGVESLNAIQYFGGMMSVAPRLATLGIDGAAVDAAIAAGAKQIKGVKESNAAIDAMRRATSSVAKLTWACLSNRTTVKLS